MNAISKWFWGWMKWKPHFIVGDPNNPYLLRWYVVPRNDWLCIYIHKFLRDDDDRAMHDHPWNSISFLIWGRYIEQTSAGRKLYRLGSIMLRKATHTHRIELINKKPAWTLFITGKRVREWGFHCPRGWVHWKEFTKPTNIGQVGKGCD